MSARIIRMVLVLIPLALFAACTSTIGQEQQGARQTPVVSHSGPAIDYVSLVDNLRAAGLIVEPVGTFTAPFFSGEPLVIKVNGQEVQVYKYSDAATTETEAAYISSDGGQINVPDPSNPEVGSISIVEWIATPHFFKDGRLIVQYIGDDPHIISALEAVLGPQFAGGPVYAVLPIPAVYNGVSLPRGGGTRREGTAPPAWLVVGSEAIPGTVAAATEEGVIADPGNTVPDLSAIPLPANTQAVIIVGSDTIKSFQTSIRPWVEGNTPLFDPSDKKLATEAEPDQTLTAFTLAPMDDVSDLLLRFDINFPIPSGDGAASYVWRLSPGLALSLEEVSAGGELSDQPSGATVTYTDYLFGFAFDIPAAWTIDGFQGAALYIYVSDEAGITGEANFTISLIGEGDLDFALNEINRSIGVLVREVRADRLGTFEVLRLDLTPTGDWPSVIWLLATDSGHAVALMPKGDPTLIEPVLDTLRAVPVRELKDLPPSVVRPQTVIQVIEIDSPIAGTEAGAAILQPGWQTYTSPAFQISLQHPPDWQPLPGYDQKYGDRDGFFQVSALSGHNLTPEEACNLEASPRFKPYGSHPQIALLHIQGQAACLILPSEDQEKDMMDQAALVVRYPKVIQIGVDTYAYLILLADEAYLGQIAQTLEFELVVR